MKNKKCKSMIFQYKNEKKNLNKKIVIAKLMQSYYISSNN